MLSKGTTSESIPHPISMWMLPMDNREGTDHIYLGLIVRKLVGPEIWPIKVRYKHLDPGHLQ